MLKLVALYFGTIILMYLSQAYYPVVNDPETQAKRHFMRRRADVFMVIVIAWMTCFSFLRTDYNDTWTYREHFRQAESVGEFIATGGVLDWTGNPLSTLYRNMIREITDNYHIYFFFPAFLSSFSIIKLCKKYSVKPAFSLLIFISIGTYIMYIAALKQCLAVFILLISLPYAIEKKYVKFYLLVFIAMLFHTHAFLFAIIPLLFGKPWGKTIWALLGLTLFGMATYDFTFGAFMEFAQSIGALVAEIELFDGHSINPLRVAVYWVPAILSIIYRKHLFEQSTRIENLFVNMSIVSAFILTLGLIQGANLFARMAGYFEIGTAIAIPWLIRKLFSKQSEKFVTVCAFALYFVYFWYENAINRGFQYDYAAISLWQFIQELFS